jgi:hypothetical protein
VVVGARTLDSLELRELPPLLRDVAADFIEAVGTRDAELLVVLRAASIVPAQVWARLAIAHGRAANHRDSENEARHSRDRLDGERAHRFGHVVQRDRAGTRAHVDDESLGSLRSHRSPSPSLAAPAKCAKVPQDHVCVIDGRTAKLRSIPHLADVGPPLLRDLRS